jgi:hypothetical protein
MTVPGTPPASLAAAIANVHVQVTPENVLEVRKALLSEAEKFLTLGFESSMITKYVSLCGGDPISEQASDAFGARINALVEHCREYGTRLRDAGNSLEGIARGYGYTESQIASSFRTADPAASA